MPRYKDYDYGQTKLVPVDFEKQILPGSFEYSLSYLIENELDLRSFDDQYKNDEEGRPAYDPRILLKIVVLAYAKGITSSRKIEQLCRENITFIALSADQQPHFTTIADFISRSPESIAELFTQVVLMCDELGLIGKEMFAIDGCKLPSNASKQWSGTHEELNKKRLKIDRAIRRMVAKHKEQDNQEKNPQIQEREQEQIKKLRAASKKIKAFVDKQEKRLGVSGKEVKSNITDNQSAKMKTSHGVIQGYTGVAAVDAKHQVVVNAEAFGQGQEHGLIEPMVEGTQEILGHELGATKLTADSGYHNGKTLDYLEEKHIDAYVADTGFRSRDPRFKDHKAAKERNKKKPQERLIKKDFKIDQNKQTCICPAGKSLKLQNPKGRIGHHLFMIFKAKASDCQACTLKKRCLKKPNQKTGRQININLGITEERKDSAIERMKRKIDSDWGRHIYSKRLGTVEPVFGHINDAIGIKRFSLRGKRKVDGQWKLMMMLHNILKIHRYGWQWA